MIYCRLKLKMVYEEEKKTKLQPVETESKKTWSNINNAAWIIYKAGARIKKFRWRQWMCGEALLFCENHRDKKL